ncbi:MAG: FHA domain-containing protein [Methanomicrobiales archaeon]
MSGKKFTIIIALIFAGFFTISLLIFGNDFVIWFQLEWLNILIAIILAIIMGYIVEYLYKKFSGRSKFSETTMINKPRKVLAKLILPEQKEFIIEQYERIFGREDFVGLMVVDELLYVGKNHFKLSRMDDGFYIEDLNTKNGTMINGEEIKGRGKIKLKNNDSIIIANVLKALYMETDIN